MSLHATLLILFCLSLSNVEATVEHATPLQENSWKVQTSRTSCVLSQEIELWGDFSIIKKAGKPVEVALKSIHSLDYDVYYAGSKFIWSDDFYPKNTKLDSFKYGGWRSDNDVGYDVLVSLLQGRATYFDLFRANQHYDRIIINPYFFQDQYASYNNCVRQLFPYDNAGMSSSRIYFDSDSYQVSIVAQNWLETLMEYINLQAELQSIEIKGFSDSSGSEAYNYKLSDLRVEKVKEFFMKQGIDESRILTRAYGERGPIADNNKMKGRSLNRRVEIIINHG